jgi:hypothetical protein
VTDAELSLDPDTFRRLGYRVIDALAHGLRVDHPRTTVADVEGTVARLGQLAADSTLV